MGDAHLTPAEKLRVVTDWKKSCLEMPHSDGQGGKGYPDKDILRWCDLLNSMPGICTIQSCAGHSSSGGRHIDSPGHLWLRLDKRMSAVFDAGALELAAAPVIERVSKIYTSWGQEIISIEFAGNERGKLEESMSLIIGFFQSLI